MENPLDTKVPEQAYRIAKEAYRISRDAHVLYRYYLYWRAQEKLVRQRSPEHLREIQWTKFKNILGFAHDRIPFYRDRFRQAGITPDKIRTREDLVRIPTLSKDDIRENFPDRLLDDTRTYSTYGIGQTSGSTRESLHFMRPANSWKRSLRYNVFLRMRGMANIPIFVLTTPHCAPGSCSLQDEENDEHMIARTLQRVSALRHLGGMISLPPPPGNILCAPDEYLETIAGMMSLFPCCMIVADPVYLGSFARYIRRSNTRIPRVISIITTYELRTGSLEDLLREVFDCDIYTQYGAAEMTDISNDCECHSLHIRTDMVLVESIRGEQPAKVGEVGRAIITDLYNYNMPFIRYDIGDAIRLGESGCPCGKNTDTIKSIQGRVFDIIETRDHRLLTPLEVDEAFRGMSGITAYRLVQRGRDRYAISIMKDGTFNGIDEHTLIERCRSLFGTGNAFEVDVVEEITPESSNKFRFVYSELHTADL